MTLFFATTLLLPLVLMALISSATATNQTSMSNQDLIVATQEMQKANYFTFVMLINMAPSDTVQPGSGITFLMPNDKTLSQTDMSESSVVDFLLRHSIPSPLLIDHLEHFPTGSTIPTSKPGLVFEVTNDGRRRLFLSNVRIVSPNICTQGSNIRCHGIDGVVQPTTSIIPQPNLPTTTPPPSCANGSSPVAAAGAMAPWPPELGGGSTFAASPPAVVVAIGGRKSSSHPIMMRGDGIFDLVMTYFMLGLMGLVWF